MENKDTKSKEEAEEEITVPTSGEAASWLFNSTSMTGPS
jgi:hypothetical protein